MIDAGETRQYRLRRDVEDAIIHRRLVRTYGLTAMLFSAILVGTVLWRGAPTEPASLLTLAIGFTVMGVVVSVQYRSAYTREHAMWRAYRLTIGPDLVRRVTSRIVPAELRREEVTRIVAVAGAGITVQSADPYRFVFIPEQLERFDEARATLERWRSIENGSPSAGVRVVGLGIVVGLAMVGAAAGSVLVPDPRIAVPLGLVALTVLVWMIVATLRNPHIPIQRRLFVSAYLGLFGLVLAARVALGLYFALR